MKVKEMEKMKNRIPRKFNVIKGKMLINTNVSKTNDLVEVTKDEYNRYIILNIRTGKTASPFVDMLRNKEVFEIIEIV